MMKKICLMATAAVLMSAQLQADTVIFKSGDRLTGIVQKVKEGKMVFDSAVAGTLNLNMADIQTFATDEAITIEKPDGTQIQTRTVASEDGNITLASDNTTLPLANITEINPEKPAWHGKLTAGANFARGNTHTDNSSVSAEASLRRENDRISLAGTYLFARQRDQSTGEDDTTEDRWIIQGKYDYFMSEKLYLYGNIFYEKDRIANLDMRVAPGGGLGYQWIEKDDMNFNTEAGLTWMHEKYTDPSETREHMVVRLAYHLDKTLWDTVKAFHNVTFLPSTERSDIYLLYADAGLQTKLIGSWIMELKAEMQHDSQPAAGLDKSDYRYILGLGYTF